MRHIYTIFVKLYIGSFHIGNIKFFVVFFVGCFDDDLLFYWVKVDKICLHWVWQISYSPLECIQCIFPHENGLYI
jgi:hypothetical protein